MVVIFEIVLRSYFVYGYLNAGSTDKKENIVRNWSLAKARVKSNGLWPV